MTLQLPYTVPGGQQVQFTPYALRGKGGGDALIVGSGSLRSENYEANSTGWRIDGLGNAEFESGEFRGDISGASGAFTGALDIGGADTTSFHVDTSGNMWLGAATFGAATFSVSSAGNLTAESGTFNGTLEGTMTATSITGTNEITNNVLNTLQSGNFVASSAGWQIKGNGDAEFNDVTIRGTLLTNGGSGAHLDVGDETSEFLLFYHGGAVELAASYITTQYSTSPAYGILVLSGPDQASSGSYATPPTIALQHYNDGSNSTVYFGDTAFVWVGSGQVIVPNGTISDPSYSFQTDTDTGIYLDGANKVGIAGSLTIESGSAGTPGIQFEADTNTGIYRIGENMLGVSTGGSERMRIGDAAGEAQISIDPEDLSVTDYDSWDDYGSPWDFHASKDVHGYVHLEGLYRNNNGATANASTYPNIILLPSGARPRDDMVFGQFTSAGTVVRVNVLASGAIQLGTAASVPSSGWVSMAGISFYAGW